MPPSPRAALLLFGGFMLFNFMTNVGPNAQTYLLAGEVFPTAHPRQGRGLRRLLRQDRRRARRPSCSPCCWPTPASRSCSSILVGTSLLGAWITWQFRIETTGVNLEEIGR